MRIKHLGYVLLLAATACEKDDPLFCEKNPGATGCTVMNDANDLGDAEGIDGDPGIDGRTCFGTGAYTMCLAAPPTGQIIFNAGDFDTSASNSLCLANQPSDWMAAGQPDSCIVVGETIVVPNLNVLGTRPLVLLASTTITINGLLDVASRRSAASKVGPGSPDPACGTNTDTPANSNSGAGGGAGGSFITIGGNGGDGNGVGDSGGAALMNLATAPMLLRAGCPGQKGGEGDATNNGGDGGPGGGALAIVAGTSIVFGDNAVINASGAGASKAGDSAGGGGAGAGGMIVLNAPAITAGSGVAVFANGGGGSSGGNDTGGCGCAAGSDPSPADPLNYAIGGAGGGGAGGGGFAQGIQAVSGGNVGSGLGGGGGGGGGGYIQSTVTLTNVSASPTPVIL